MKKDFKLPKEFGIKWLEALRSGEYTQIPGKLVDVVENGAFDMDTEDFLVGDPFKGCCLGIGALICGAEHTQLGTAGLPEDVVEYLEGINYPSELSEETHYSQDLTLPTILAAYNDGDCEFEESTLSALYPNTKFEYHFNEHELRNEFNKLSFEEIANWVEQNVEFYE